MGGDSVTAVYAGSFDPFTYGHLSVVTEAATIFDDVAVVVATNVKKRRVFDREAMAAAIDGTMRCAGLNNVRVLISDELTANVCRSLGARYLIRGLRNTTDYMYEEEIAKFNQRLNPNLRTIYVRATDDTISSSGVRELWAHNQHVMDYVPPKVVLAMKGE